MPDASQAQIPSTPAAGLILGRPFRLGKAVLKVSAPRAVPLPRAASGPPQTSSRVTYTLVLVNKGRPSGASAPDGCTIFLTLPHRQKIEGRSFVVDPQGVFAMQGKAREQGALYPPVQGMLLTSHPPRKSAAAETPRKYTLRLEFGKAQKGRIPGRISLSAQDPGKSWALGSFTAAITHEG